MPKSPEQYQPSEEEIKKAEDTMTPEQKGLSEEREETIEYGHKKAKEELDSEKLKETMSKDKEPEVVKAEIIKPKEKIRHPFILEGVGAGIRTSFINEIKNSAFINNVKISIDESGGITSTLRIELRGNRDDVIVVTKDIENMMKQIRKKAKNIMKSFGFNNKS